MKRITLLALLFVTSLASLMAQVTTPQGFNYQAVVRNSAGQLIVNGEVNLRLSILQGSANGALVYSYSDHVQTNQNGVITVVVGGTLQYKSIDWSHGPFFLKSEIDPSNGNNFSLSTTQQLLSVPYAHHADVADHVSEAFTYDERDPLFRGWGYEYDSLRNAPTRLSQFVNDLGFLTAGDLDLSISGDTLFINGGDYVVLPPIVTSLPWDSITGRPTNLSQFVNDLNLSDLNNDMNLSDFNNDLSLSSFTNNLSLSSFTNDMSLSDFPNDLNFSIHGDTLFLDNNKFVVLPHNLVDSLDWNKIYNEPTRLSQFINDLNLSDFNNDLNLSDFNNDLSLSNFVNDLSLSDFQNDLAFTVKGDTLFLNDTTFVTLPHNLVDSLDWNIIFNEPTMLSQFINDLGLSDFNNDIMFTISGDTIFLGDNNNYVILPHNLSDSLDWSRIINRPTNLSQFINDLNLSDLNNDMSLSDFVNDLSLSDFQNDLNFSVSGDTLFLNDTTFVLLPHNLVDSLDWNLIYNEPTRLSQFINDLNLSDFNNDMSLSDFNNDLNLSDLNNDMSLSDFTNDLNLSNFVNDLSLSDFENDLNFSVSGDTLFLNDTTFVTLPHNLVDSLDWNIIFNEPTMLSQFINDLGLSDFNNDIMFTISGDTIFLGDNNNYVILPHNLSDSLDWSRIINRPTNLSQFINDLNMSDLNNDMSLSDFVNDLSLSDFENDLAFAVKGDTLFLNDTTFVLLPHNLVDSLDWNLIYNEPTRLSQFINDLNLSDFNNDLNLSDLNNDMSLSDFPNDLGYLTAETQGLSDVLSFNNDASAGITNLPTPVNGRDAVNKDYADSVAAHEAQAVRDDLNARIDSLAHAIDSINARNSNIMDSMMAVVDSLAHPLIEGCRQGLFSVSAEKRVLFSKGNLQYNPHMDIFRFADNQYDALTTENMWISESYNGWIDLFGYGTSGWKGGRSCFRPYETNTNDAMYMINSTGTGDDLAGIYENADWGIYNRIINGANTPGVWRTLNYSEWTYLLNDRPNAATLKTLATVNSKRGLILLPDNWQTPAGVTILYTMSNYNDVTYDAATWKTLEDAGAIFLPSAGIRFSNTVTEHNVKGYYWSSTHTNVTTSRTLNIDTALGARMDETNSGRGCSVRLVRDY